AREYLVRSISVAHDIADALPPTFQASYLTKSWYRDSRKSLEICNRGHEGAAMVRSSAVATQQAKYFEAIYQLSISAMTATSAEAVLAALVETIELTLNRPTAVILNRAEIFL